jgi:hypothetical protein
MAVGPSNCVFTLSYSNQNSEGNYFFELVSTDENTRKFTAKVNGVYDPISYLA